MNSIKYLLILLSCWPLTACSVTYREGTYEDFEYWPPQQKKQLKTKPSLKVVIKSQEEFSLAFGRAFHDKNVDNSGNAETDIIHDIQNSGDEQKYDSENIRMSASFKRQVVNAYIESQLFSSVTTDPEAKTDLTTEIEIHTDFNSPLSFCMTCCLFDILPSHFTLENNVITTLRDSKDKILATYSVSEDIYQLRHITLVVVAPFSENSERVFNKTFYDLSRATIILSQNDVENHTKKISKTRNQ